MKKRGPAYLVALAKRSQPVRQALHDLGFLLRFNDEAATAAGLARLAELADPEAYSVADVRAAAGIVRGQ